MVFLRSPAYARDLYFRFFRGVQGTMGNRRRRKHRYFAIILFVGMIVHGLFAECINRAPALILSNVNYVKKVVFPLEILPWVAFGSALFHTVVSIIVLLLAQLILNHQVALDRDSIPVLRCFHWYLLQIGFAWFLAAFGVFMRDIGQITGMFTTVLLFLSPCTLWVCAGKISKLATAQPACFYHRRRAKGSGLWATA